MIIKKREKSLELEQLEALARRLHPTHPAKKVVQKDYKNRKSGIRGEKEIDYPLGFLNEKEYLILHDLRLFDENGYFQIDSLVVCERYILILEVKNWYGTLLFDEKGQVIRIGDDQVEEGFPNPIPQVKMQMHRLQKWLNKSAFPTIPLKFFVVIAFPNTILKSISPNYSIPKQVIHSNHLFFEIQELNTICKTPMVNMDQLIKLSGLLIKSHTPTTKNILDEYNISVTDLLKGVICPQCSAVPMIWERGKWRCMTCDHRSTDAHLFAWYDYELLIGNKISNQVAKEFLQITSSYVVKRLLQKAHLRYVGENKGRLYELDFTNEYKMSSADKLTDSADILV